MKILDSVNCRRKIICSLKDSYSRILADYEYINREIRENREVVASSEWLIDNIYLIEKEYKTIRVNMPWNYFKNLPLTDGMESCPRIYTLSNEYIKASDGKVEEKDVIEFLNAHDKEKYLTLGELWAFPLILRVTLIEAISVITDKLAYIQREKRKGEDYAYKVIDAYNKDALCEFLVELNKDDVEVSREFIEKFTRVLRDNSVYSEEIYQWALKKSKDIEAINEIIEDEHKEEGKLQLSIGNCITSLRTIDAIGWREVFDKISRVEKILKMDPHGTYSRMDFESKDYYRHRIEEISRNTGVEEYKIAEKAIQLSELSKQSQQKEYEAHVGYYLFDKGQVKLGENLGHFKIIKKRFSTKIFILEVFFILGIIESLILGLASYINKGIETWELILGGLIMLLPAWDMAITFINWNIAKYKTPYFIPKLEFKEGIDGKYSTIVVIPAITGSIDRVKELMNQLEVFYLSNKDSNLYFALLGDFNDSNNEVDTNDDEINDVGIEEAKRLNNKYFSQEKEHFFFLNRQRLYNEKQGVWMGWERKRGKLMEFMALLREDSKTTYNVISSDISQLKKAKYIITLDADTILPMGAAKKLIGAMSHIINRPELDTTRKKILRGYGIMQPRVSISVEGANKTFFTKTFAGDCGLDIYSTASSDTYQDMFGEGIFTGKGILDIDVFFNMLKEEIPENTILSHDLLEGAFSRCGLVTDVEFIDGYPAYYKSSCTRLHRWVRGDWQLFPWIFDNRISGLSKWQIVDNLRRSLNSPAILFALFISVLFLKSAEYWTVAGLFEILVIAIFSFTDFVIAPKHYRYKSRTIFRGIKQILLIISFIPHQCILMLDAIIRTLYRMIFSKKNLLEWKTAADAEKSCRMDFKNYISSMWVSSVIGLIYFYLGFYSSEKVRITTSIVSILWIISPVIAYVISKEKVKEVIKISEEDKVLLKEICRRTWAYYEDFVNEENNYLAPDNFQEDPNNGVAFRTSPTNMAMGLITNITAYDMGYIGISEVINRLEKILDNMDSLDKYEGHFYNWYDTKTKKPLWPRYVSTVDSGNLVGYLWVIIEALEEYKNYPLIREKSQEALLDVINLVEKELGEIEVFSSEKRIIKEERFSVEGYITLLNSLLGKVIEIESNKKEQLFWLKKLKMEINLKLKELDELCYININKLNNDSTTFNIELYKKISISNIRNSLEKYGEEYRNSIEKIEKLIDRIDNLNTRLKEISDNTNFRALYNEHRKIFSIGYDIENCSMGKSYYDLLASEARAASFIAIAKGEVEYDHWFKLGRAMTNSFGEKSLVSWSGTMFEYLMPSLIMKNYEGTLWDMVYKSVIQAQKKYAKLRKIPWGISESAYYHFDSSMNYQYKAFGVPGIGLKRGLVDELVVSPYSTVMALPFDITGGIENLKELINLGMLSTYGFYEALDYTRERVPKGKFYSPVKCFMVHHQGMSLMALDNVLNNNILQKRFHRTPEVKAFNLLLQEKQYYNEVFTRERTFSLPEIKAIEEQLVPREYPAVTEYPEVLLLSNGSYSTMITNSGGGYSQKGDMMLYRWKSDSTQGSGGMYFYIKNLNSNDFWSAAFEPCKIDSDDEENSVTFTLDKAVFRRRDGNIDTTTEVAVSTEDNVEVRRINLRNNSEHYRIIEVTSYMEVTLTTYSSDIVHPTFSNLFIITQYDEDNQCVIANRRPRAKGQKKPHMMQTLLIEGEQVGTISYETSRLNFIGRNRDLANPKSMDNDSPLENTQGIVLDPIISMRARIKIPPKSSSRVSFITGLGESIEEVRDLSRKYKDVRIIERVFKGSLQQVLIDMRYLGIKSFQANIYQALASHMLFLNSSREERDEYIKNIRKHQRDLWPFGISGDLPILLLIVKEYSDGDLVRQVVTLHHYWKTKGLKVDLVIYNEEDYSYEQPGQKNIIEQINTSPSREYWNKPGGIYLHSKSTMGEDIRDFLKGIARLVISADKGTLLDQIKQLQEEEEENLETILRHKELVGVKVKRKHRNVSQGIEGTVALNEYNPKSQSSENLKWEQFNKSEFKKEYQYDIDSLDYYNGYGGFKKDGSGYVIVLRNFEESPAPWINVISNGDFGFHISESGSAYTWALNSREYKITPWNNDWVMDSPGETLYLRDNVKGEVWSITPKPLRDEGEYIIEHNYGYSTFAHTYDSIEGKLTVFCPMNEKIKLLRIELKNNSEEEKKISLFYYGQMVLGVVPQQTSQYISTYIEKGDNQFIWAQNPYSQHFGNLKAYLSVLGGEDITFTGDRKEFIGRKEDILLPHALKQEKLSNSCGGSYDPCLAASVNVNIPSKETKTIVVAFGVTEDIKEGEQLLRKYALFDAVNQSLEEVKAYWSNFLGRIRVKTPDKSLDYLVNGWLMYQTLSCRYWARTAFYQSGGAMGFRDQLQDSMAIGLLNPNITRNQILISASRQYEEGDVQHWWHPVVNSGIRTRFSDDLLWLPFVVCKYIKNTGDYSILDEEVPYLHDVPLAEGEDERYTEVDQSNLKGTIYEHCIKTIERGLRFGVHNIPLMGSGDWNDGMSTVGNEGKGESVWLGWFLYEILRDMEDICIFKKDEERLEYYSKSKEFIRENIEKNAWDGGWYRRAFFDDGTPLGSMQNDECQIDSLAQSWAAITGAGKPTRVKEAMEAVDKYLVKEDKGMILLLAPPFNNSRLEPGYIKGYVPGVRENGGQYTHASIWVILALTKLGLGDKAWKYFHMLNPINHSSSVIAARNYKVEPYVMTADIYIKEPHSGRGGWSWYTGAAGWTYKLAIENILGFTKYYGKGFKIKPCIPSHWNEFEIEYNEENMTYKIEVKRGKSYKITMDGKVISSEYVPFEKGEHNVIVYIE